MFFVTVAISPPSTKHIGFYENYTWVKLLAAITYSLFPIYVIVTLLIRVLPRKPISLEVDDFFQIILVLFSSFFIWGLLKIADVAKQRGLSTAIKEEIQRSIKDELITVIKEEVQLGIKETLVFDSKDVQPKINTTKPNSAKKPHSKHN